MSTMEELEERAREAQAKFDEAQRAYRDAKFAVADAKRAIYRRCHWCGKTDDDNEDEGYGPLVDFRLVCADGEEGYANVLRFCCQGHMEWLQVEFDKLGFTIHAHGGICFLESVSCPAYEGSMSLCVTPEEQFPGEEL